MTDSILLYKRVVDLILAVIDKLDFKKAWQKVIFWMLEFQKSPFSGTNMED